MRRKINNLYLLKDGRGLEMELDDGKTIRMPVAGVKECRPTPSEDEIVATIGVVEPEPKPAKKKAKKE